MPGKPGGDLMGLLLFAVPRIDDSKVVDILPTKTPHFLRTKSDDTLWWEAFMNFETTIERHVGEVQLWEMPWQIKIVVRW